MSDLQKITEQHRRRRAVVYVRQSTMTQVERNHESRARQYALRQRAIELGGRPRRCRWSMRISAVRARRRMGGWGSRSWSPRSASGRSG